MKVTSYTKTGKKSKVTVSDEVFAAPVNIYLLSQAIKVYQSNQRQGTSRVKSRGEVRLTKRKWYAQKGTGNARHGAQSANLFVGGGVAHGPKGVENWKRSLSKKQKHSALISALSAQVAKDNVIVTDRMMDLEGKTKPAAEMFADMVGAEAKTLVVLPNEADNYELIMRSLQNLPLVMVVAARTVNALDIASADKIIISKSAADELEARLTGSSK